jgi:hypothetical protein
MCLTFEYKTTGTSMQSSMQESCVSARVIALKVKDMPTWLLWCLGFFSFNIGHLEGIICWLLLRAMCFQKCIESLGQLSLLDIPQLFTTVLAPVSGSVRSLLHAKSVREDSIMLLQKVLTVAQIL